MSPARSYTAVFAALLFVALPARAPAGAASKSGDDFRYLPDNAQFVCVIRVDELLASDAVKKLRKEIPEIDEGFGEYESPFRKEFGFEFSNVDRVTVGSRLKGGFPISVFRLKKPVDVKTVLKARKEAGFKFDNAIKFKEERVGPVTWYVSDKESHPEAVCFPNATTVVFGRANDLKPLLQRNKGAVLSGVVQAAFKEADPGATIMLAVDVKAGFDALKPLLDFLQVRAERPEAADAVSLTIKVANNFALHGVMVCKDGTAAQEVQKQAEGFRTAALAKLKDAPPGMYRKDILDLPMSVKLSTRGNLVETSVSLSAGLLINEFKRQKARETASTAPDRYALDDANVLGVIRLDQLLASDLFKKLLHSQMGPFGFYFSPVGSASAIGFGIDTGKRLILSGNTDHLDRFIGAFHLHGGIKADMILKRKAHFSQQKLMKEKVGSFTLYAPAEGGEGFSLLDDRTLLVSGGKELKEVLARKRPANLSAGLRDALKHADPGATVTLALDMSALPADKPALPGVDLKKVIDGARAAVLTIKISGHDITLYAAAVCKDARGAAAVQKQAEAFRAFLVKQAGTAPPSAKPKEIAELLGKVKFATKGTLIETTLTVKDDTALALLKVFLLPDLDLNPNLDDPGGMPPSPDFGKQPPDFRDSPPKAPKAPVAEKNAGEENEQDLVSDQFCRISMI
jgi:hypothetical protein